MTPVPPPHGMSEVDYATIEAAVTETVRGRWFLNEFARRNRAAELRQLLDAMARIENVVGTGSAALAPADPSIRLLMQRIKDIASQLDTLSHEMREAGIDERFTAAVEKEARAVSGMMRGPVLSGTTPARPSTALPKPDAPSLRELRQDATAPSTQGSTASTPAPVLPPTAATIAGPDHPTGDRRLALLADLDRLSLTEKLALFA